MERCISRESKARRWQALPSERAAGRRDRVPSYPSLPSFLSVSLPISIRLSDFFPCVCALVREREWIRASQCAATLCVTSANGSEVPPLSFARSPSAFITVTLTLSATNGARSLGACDPLLLLLGTKGDVARPPPAAGDDASPLFAPAGPVSMDNRFAGALESTEAFFRLNILVCPLPRLPGPPPPSLSSVVVRPSALDFP